jgi:hypothetical protein
MVYERTPLSYQLVTLRWGYRTVAKLRKYLSAANAAGRPVEEDETES